MRYERQGPMIVKITEDWEPNYSIEFAQVFDLRVLMIAAATIAVGVIVVCVCL